MWCRQQVYVLKRPYVDEFLQRMGELFECVLFTASLAKVSSRPGQRQPVPGAQRGPPEPQVLKLTRAPPSYDSAWLARPLAVSILSSEPRLPDRISVSVAPPPVTARHDPVPLD